MDDDAFLCRSGFYIALDYTAYCSSPDIDWPQCRSSRSIYDFSMGKDSDVLSHKMPSASRCTADRKS